MTTPDDPVEFEWASSDSAPPTSSVATRFDRSRSRIGRLRVPALVAAVAAVALVVVVSSTFRSDGEVAPPLVAPGRLSLTVDPVWSQMVEVGIEPASVRVTGEAVVFIVADRGGSFRKVEALALATGGSLWERRSGTDVVTNVVTVTERTYVVETTVEDDRRLVGYDLATGETTWEEQLDSFGSIVALPSVPLLVEVPNGLERVTSMRDADSGEVVAQFDASYAGTDLAGMMRLIDADGVLSTLDLAAFEETRRDRGVVVAANAVESVVRGALTRAGPAAIVGGELVSANEQLIMTSGSVVAVRDTEGGPVELAPIVGLRPVGTNRLVIETFDGVGGSLLHGGAIRRGSIEIDWTFEGFIDRSADGDGVAFMSESGERAIAVTPGDGEPAQVGLLDLVTGDRLVEFESLLRPERSTAGNGVLTNITSSDDGFMTTVIAYDQGGTELWRIGPTRSSLGAAIGDEFVVTLARDADGGVVMTGHGP